MLQQKFAIPIEQSTALAATKTSPDQPNPSPRSNNNNGNRGGRGRGNNNTGRGGNQGRGNWGSQQWNYNYNRNNRGGHGSSHTRGPFRGGNSNGRGILPTPTHMGQFFDPNTTCQLCYQYGHNARVCTQRNNATYFSQSELYVLDSGATNHMTSNPSNLTEYSSYTGAGDSSFWQ
ncbi:uncharacterized protein LOC128126698 [Lactuca sativa]|uniref:uncharacterized protein LOC128126698 n=1 Tax=Lactuca sativa TaxID=4236 RepID=UPI0022AF82A6|nr:uncharacterized protein LOC128126698 [Lactuca sativa]